MVSYQLPPASLTFPFNGGLARCSKKFLKPQEDEEDEAARKGVNNKIKDTTVIVRFLVSSLVFSSLRYPQDFGIAPHYASLNMPRKKQDGTLGQ